MLLFNTLSGKKERFKPIDAGRVRMYTCGPTVYDYAHIGNLRAYIFSDTLRRALQYNGYEVLQVMNITDVGHLTSDSDEGEDKMLKGLKREGKEISVSGMRELADIYTQAFTDDLKALNILPPNVMPRATDHIKEDIELIQTLEAKGAIYKTSDGVYFDISKFPEYGKLGKINIEALKSGARVERNPEKRHPADFALWKFGSEKLGFSSPWGHGFPGWHLECSAMIGKHLGQPIDIHTGGIDHIGTHHNGEIAQSELAHDKPLANYWLHVNHLVMTTGKMAKSGGTALTLKSLTEEGVHPLSYRFWILQAHYQTPLTWSLEAVRAAESAFKRLIQALASKYVEGKGAVISRYETAFKEAVNDNLNTSEALAIISKLIDSTEKPADIAATLISFDDVLGLSLASYAKSVAQAMKEPLPAHIEELKRIREEARNDKNWAESDSLRRKIEEAGFAVHDTKEGTEILPEIKL